MSPEIPPVPAPTRLLGVSIHNIHLNELLSYLRSVIQAGDKSQVMNVNVHAMNLAYELPAFRQVLNQANVVFCDGFGVKWGAILHGKRISYRYTPPDWIPQLCELCVTEGFSLFFLGAKPGVAERAAKKLTSQYPGLKIAGVQAGYFDKSPGSPENEQIIAQVNAAHANLLIVGFGMPLQEMWLAENWNRLNVNVGLTAGAVFDYVAGEVPRPPVWMTEHGLEWLGRLLVEPKRLWKRYLIGNPLFLWRLVRHWPERNNAA